MGIWLGIQNRIGRRRSATYILSLLDKFEREMADLGATYDKELFTYEVLRQHPIVLNEAAVLIACGAYKAGIIYGINMYTGAAVPFTFGRASEGTYIDKNGLLQTAGNNVPRINYDIVDLGLKGYLHENGVTEILLNSTFATGATGWTQSGTNIGYDTGVTTAAGRDFVRVYKTDSITNRGMTCTAFKSLANTVFTVRITIRAASSNRVSLGIGAIADPGGANISWGGVDYTGFRKLKGPGTFVNSNGLITVNNLSSSEETIIEIFRRYVNADIDARLYIYPGAPSSTTEGDDVLISTPQIEINELGVCTSQIDTNGSQKTRAAETMYSQSDLIVDSGSTLYFEGSKLSNGSATIGSNTIFRRNTPAAGLAFYNSNGASEIARFRSYDGTSGVDINATGMNGLPVKVALSFGADGQKTNISSNPATLVKSSYDGLFGTTGFTAPHWFMGTAGTGNGRVQNHMRTFAIIHRQLSDAEHIDLVS